MFNEEDYRFFYKRDFPMIRSLVVKMLGNDAEAEDIFHETLMVLVENSKKKDFSLFAKASTYMYSVARNICHSRIRAALPGSEVGEIPDVQDAPSEDDLSETSKKLQSCLENLPEKQRMIISKFYYDKQSLKEIAEDLKMSSTDSVKTQKYRAIQALKQCFKSKK